jgi:TonB family protein
MPKSHRPTRRSFRLVLFLSLTLCIAVCCPWVSAQQPATDASPDRDQGIKLYRQGKLHEAIKILREVTRQHPQDADAWYFLGVAYYSDATFLYARDAFEHLLSLRPDSADANAKLSYALILGSEAEQATTRARRAIELGDQSAEPHYAIAEASFRFRDYGTAIAEADKALAINPDFGPALITKGLSYSSLKQYGDAATTFERFLASNSSDPDADVWREQLESLRRSTGQNSAPTNSGSVPQPVADVPLSGREVTGKARVLEKMEPTYTEAARKAGVSGTVILKGVFSQSGEVKDLVVIRALGYGLTSKAVQAARKIRFVPATKNGQPVSMWMELQYNFNLY